MFNLNPSLRVDIENFYGTEIYHIRDFYKYPDEVYDYLYNRERSLSEFDRGHQPLLDFGNMFNNRKESVVEDIRFEVDDDGFYYFKGRADDLIKVSGQWVYPLEIELCLVGHPCVKECAVLGVELVDKRMSTKAFVVLNEFYKEDNFLTRDLKDYAKEKLLPHKYPRSIVYLKSLPKTGSGKIDRQKLN